MSQNVFWEVRMDVKLWCVVLSVVFGCCFWVSVLCLRARETNKERDRQTQRERRDWKIQRKRQIKESKLSRENTHKRKGNKKNEGAACFAQSPIQSRMRINVPNKTGLTLPVSYFVLAQSPASRFLASFFLPWCAHAYRQGKQREKTIFSHVVSHSSQSLSSLSLSHTAQRRPTVLVSQ